MFMKTGKLLKRIKNQFLTKHSNKVYTSFQNRIVHEILR